MDNIVNSPALQHIAAIFAAVSGVCILFFLALFIAWLYVVVDIVRSEFKKDTDKLIWFIFIMVMPPLAVPLYFIIGRHQKIDYKRDDESSHTSVS